MKYSGKSIERCLTIEWNPTLAMKIVEKIDELYPVHSLNHTSKQAPVFFSSFSHSEVSIQQTTTNKDQK